MDYGSLFDSFGKAAVKGFNDATKTMGEIGDQAGKDLKGASHQIDQWAQKTGVIPETAHTLGYSDQGMKNTQKLLKQSANQFYDRKTPIQLDHASKEQRENYNRNVTNDVTHSESVLKANVVNNAIGAQYSHAKVVKDVHHVDQLAKQGLKNDLPYDKEASKELNHGSSLGNSRAGYYENLSNLYATELENNNDLRLSNNKVGKSDQAAERSIDAKNQHVNSTVGIAAKAPQKTSDHKFENKNGKNTTATLQKYRHDNQKMTAEISRTTNQTKGVNHKPELEK